MAAIHGIVNWGHSASTASLDVTTMLAALSGTQLGAAEVESRSSDSIQACLAAQREPAESAAFDVIAYGADRTLWLADLQLHARNDLRRSVAGIAPPESDLRLLIAAWEVYGDRIFDRLVAEGVVIRIDLHRRRVRCWRDPLGVRPLYLHHRPGRLVFSSDLRSLVSHREVDGRIDLRYARARTGDFTFQDRRRTAVVGVEKLPSGHWADIDAHGVRLSRHWKPHDPPSHGRLHRVDDYVYALKSTVAEAVSARLDGCADPIGVHLSGGLDSSSIATLAARMHPDVRGFSWAPSPDQQPMLDPDERALVLQVADAASIPMHFTTLTPEVLADVAYRDAALRPVAALNIEAQTSRDAAARGVRLMLSGWGGDEGIAFNGRGYFADLARRGRILRLQRELDYRSVLHGGSVPRMWLSRVALPYLPDRLYARTAVGRPAPTPPLPKELRAPFADALREVEPLERPTVRERPGVARMQVALLEHGHLQLRLESWASHGFDIGIRYSFPLLDRRVLELALTIPPDLHFRDGWKRWVFRTAMDGVLPDEVRWNLTKFDSAAEVQLNRVLRAPSPAYRERLQEGRGSPLVDVELVIDKQERYRRYALQPDPSLLRPDDDLIGGGVWWAFSDLRL